MSVQQNRQNYGNAEPVKPFGRKKQIEGERMLPLFFLDFSLWPILNSLITNFVGLNESIYTF